MNKVMRMGSQYRLISDEDIQVLENLPSKTFTVEQNPVTEEFYLSPIGEFKLPSRMYGDTHQMAERIMNTYHDRANTTGVHLTGVKGSGKTLLAKAVCVLAQQQGIPVVVVNKAHCGDEFNKFIQGIHGGAVILFDEFEKVYDYDQQSQILTLLDGVYNSKKLVIITSNEFNRVNSYMRNRPGRIYYDLSFNTLDVNFVREYCEENLKNKTHIESIVNYVTVFSFFSFDMLSAVVEEMNRYNETLLQVLKYLNIKPEMSNSEKFSVTLKLNNTAAVLNENYRFDPNIFVYEFDTDIDAVKNRFNDEQKALIYQFADEWGDVLFNSDHLHQFDAAANEFTYRKQTRGHDLYLIVKRETAKEYNFMNHLV